jgi:hypothetical protein
MFHTGSAINSAPSVLPFPNRECAPITLIGAATLKSIEASVHAQITAGRRAVLRETFAMPAARQTRVRPEYSSTAVLHENARTCR